MAETQNDRGGAGSSNTLGGTPPPRPANQVPDLPPVGSYHFRLPRLTPDAFAEVDGGEHGSRVAVNFDERFPLEIVQAADRKWLGALVQTRLSNIPRERGKKGSGQYISDWDYLNQALGEKARPASAAECTRRLIRRSKSGGAAFAANLGYVWPCLANGDALFPDANGGVSTIPNSASTDPAKPNRQGCGRIVYQGQVEKVSGEYPVRVICPGCGAQLGAHAQLTVIGASEHGDRGSRAGIKGIAWLFAAGLVLLTAYGLLEGVPFPTLEIDLFHASYDSCTGFVLAKLEAPSTADFAGRWSDDTSITSAPTSEGQEYEVASYVDAQNHFGARTRTWFACSVTCSLTRLNRFVELPEPHWALLDLKMLPAGGSNETATQAAVAASPVEDPSQAAIDLAKHSHALAFNYRLPANAVLTNPGDPVLHDTEHAIQNELAHLQGTLHVIGWKADKVDDQTYLVSYAFEQAAGASRSWYFEVNLAAGIVRNVLADEALKKKYGLQGRG
jgi:hypothetical protein